jgi:hypothetical protein
MTPVIRQYATNMNEPNTCCGDNNFPIVPGSGSGEGKKVEILSSPTVSVENLSDVDTYRFRPNVVQYVALTADLTLVAKEEGVAKSNPVLKGTVIDAIELDWVYNKVIASQSLSNTGGLSNPTLSLGDRSHDYEGLNIISNLSFTISGNDGNGQPGSIANSTRSITFGNYMMFGVSPDLTLAAVGTLLALVPGMTKVIKTSRNHTYFPTGGPNQHHLVLYEKAWGLGTFTKGIFTGGYVRLKNVGGVLKIDLNPGDIETDILLTNDKGYQAAYYVYMSLYDNQDDPVNSFTIS